jgi:hypothetical protein
VLLLLLVLLMARGPIRPGMGVPCTLVASRQPTQLVTVTAIFCIAIPGLLLLLVVVVSVPVVRCIAAALSTV